MKSGYQLLYLDSHSLLVVTPKEGLKRLLCPFPVTCEEKVGTIRKGTTVTVEMVLTYAGDATRLVFVIEGKAYLHSHFSIKIVL